MEVCLWFVFVLLAAEEEDEAQGVLGGLMSSCSSCCAVSGSGRTNRDAAAHNLCRPSQLIGPTATAETTRSPHTLRDHCSLSGLPACEV